MRSYFDDELDILNNELIKMGSLVEDSIQGAVNSLLSKDRELAKNIIEQDDQIDAMEKSIENRCMQLLLRQHPVAGDLRLISSILKMITDLERIGDQAEDIAEISLLLADEKLIKELTHIPQMGEATIKMLNNSIDAFVNRNKELAYEVIAFDDVVDDLFDTIKDELIELINKDINTGEQAINLIMIAKYLERIGDHAQNVAEWVLYAIIGDHRKIKEYRGD
ncbi:MAG TPA: phosphate signaling complex protein PhoU [Tissierellaceae bacterium]|nr:phosphate signaling complex protein PhoU [Tissierellaceae bacterium]